MKHLILVFGISSHIFNYISINSLRTFYDSIVVLNITIVLYEQSYE
jgi:hypothetical protein